MWMSLSDPFLFNSPTTDYVSDVWIEFVFY